MELQSGIVIAVVIGAVLLVDRLGGTDELARRLYQVALGFSLAYFVVSGTRFVVDPNSFGDTNKELNRQLAVTAIEFALGIFSVLLGIGGLRRWRTVPLGIAVGGMILLLTAGGTTDATVVDYLFASQGLKEASRGFQLTSFALGGLAFGAALWFGFTHWDRESDLDADAEDEERDPDSTA